MEKRKFIYREKTYEDALARTKGNVKESYLKLKDAKWFVTKDDKSNPGEADHYWRPLPAFWPTATHFGLDIYYHPKIGADEITYLCPKKMLNKSCPICEAQAVTEDKNKANELRPKARVLQIGIDREHEDKGPLFWAPPKKRFDTILMSTATNKKTGSVKPIENADRGCDIYFKVVGTKPFIEYTAIRCEDPSPLSDDSERYNNWLEYAEKNQLPDLLVIHDYDFLYKEFHGKTINTNDDIVQTSTVTQTLTDNKSSETAIPSVNQVSVEKPGSKWKYEDIQKASTEELDNILQQVAESFKVDENIVVNMNDDELKKYLCTLLKLTSSKTDETLSPAQFLRNRFKRNSN